MADNNHADIVARIKKNLLKGYKEDSLRWALINQGYSSMMVDRALRQAKAEIASEEKEEKEKEEIRKARDRPKITYQIYDGDDKPIKFKKSFFKRMFKRK